LVVVLGEQEEVRFQQLLLGGGVLGGVVEADDHHCQWCQWLWPGDLVMNAEPVKSGSDSVVVPPSACQ